MDQQQQPGMQGSEECRNRLPSIQIQQQQQQIPLLTLPLLGQQHQQQLLPNQQQQDLQEEQQLHQSQPGLMHWQQRDLVAAAAHLSSSSISQ